MSSNACLYTEQGTGTATVEGEDVRSDDPGVALSAADLAVAFQPLRRGKHAGKSGHGVGPTIMPRLAERCGWAVELSSTLGVGTSATARFPNPQPVQG